MDGMNNGLEMGYGYGLIIGIIVLVYAIWLFVELLYQNKE